MGFRLILMGVAAFLAVIAGPPNARAADTYDMKSMLNQPHPFAAPYSPPPPAYVPPPPPAAYPAGAGRAYDMKSMLNQPNPFAAGGQAPVSAPVYAPPPPTSYSAGAGRAYDMSVLLNQRHPFDTGRSQALPVASPPPAAAPQPQPLPLPLPLPQPQPQPKTADDDEDLDLDLDLEETAEDEGDNDPLESMNRVFFGLNEYLHDYLLKPVATTYNYLPVPVRDTIGNFLGNLNNPVILFNDVLQFEPKRAWETTERMVINTTVGVGGLFDVADYLGIAKHDEDFGQTLAVWGVGEGFYIVLPVLGPTNPRDAFGKLAIDSYLDPLNYWLGNTDRDEFIWARAGIGGIDQYAGIVEELEQVRSTSIDYYAAIRSMYRQKRQSEIKNGDESGLPGVPDLYDDLEEFEIN